jgi:hypothetical protein
MSFELEDDGRGRRKQAAPLKGISAAAHEVELEDAVAELVEVAAHCPEVESHGTIRHVIPRCAGRILKGEKLADRRCSPAHTR